MRQPPATLNYALLQGSTAQLVSNKDGACKTQKADVPKAGARVKLTFAREEKKERKKETLPLLQQRAKLITCLFINEKIIISSPLVRQWMGQKNRELIYVCRSL